MPRHQATPAASPAASASWHEREKSRGPGLKAQASAFARKGRKQERAADINSAAGWQKNQELFPPLDAQAQGELARLSLALERVRPLKGAHRRSLPDDIVALSCALTCERSELKRSYWSKPAFVSAYLYYFLPWNLVRLARLFRGLPLQPPGKGAVPSLLLDAGSGPLTVPMALWLAHPEWRTLPLQVLALDSARQPLELGRALFEAWGEVLGEPVWPVHLERGPLEGLAERAWPLLRQGACPWLITAANALNEARPLRRCHGTAAQDPDAGAEEADPGREDERLERLLAAWSPLLAPLGKEGKRDCELQEGQRPCLLFAEPGTRLGGTTLMRLRQLALDGGLSALAPCVDDNACPLARGAWCHFTFSPQGAPGWLAELSSQAGLAKRSLSLSALMLALPNHIASAAQDSKALSNEARILSSPFQVPNSRGLARYACAACGLALLEDAAALPSGALVCLGKKDTAGSGGSLRHDARSGARIFAPPALAPAGLKFKKKS